MDLQSGDDRRRKVTFNPLTGNLDAKTTKCKLLICLHFFGVKRVFLMSSDDPISESIHFSALGPPGLWP